MSPVSEVTEAETYLSETGSILDWPWCTCSTFVFRMQD